MQLVYKTYKSKTRISEALGIIRKNRLYVPGSGLIFRMTKIGFSEYNFEKIVIGFDEGVPMSCIVVDRKNAKPDWTCYSREPGVPNDFRRINVWVRPAYRRQGIGGELMKKAAVLRSLGVECYDTGPAARNLYAKLRKKRLI